jgi:two-component system OmpR family sensor kinase
MKAAASLQKRLVVGLTLLMSLLWLTATAISGFAIQERLNKVFDNALEETAQRLLPLAILEIFNRESPGVPQRVAPLKIHQSHYSYLVRDDKGTALLQSYAADTELFGADPKKGFTTTATHRVFTASALQDTLFMEIAEPLAARRAATLDAALSLLLPLLLLVPISVIGIWLVVRLSLRNILSYRHAIEARSASDLSPIEDHLLPRQIEPIANEVNRLRQRLRRALDAERSCTANSAHELRTPIATLLAQTQRLRRETAGSPTQTRVEQIEASVQDLSRLSEKLLQLAKAEGGGLLSETPQDLMLLLEHIAQDARRKNSNPIRLFLPEVDSLYATVDPDAFAILVRNLIENAVKHGAPGGEVEIRLSGTGLLRVVNPGPVIPKETLGRLSGRFVRGDSQASGSGLGLTIAKMIARGFGSELMLFSPAQGRADGFEASVQLILEEPGRFGT